MAHHHHHHDQVYNTNHYVWSSRDRLGYGATGAVYLGYNKVVLSACLSHYHIAGKSDGGIEFGGLVVGVESFYGDLG